MSFQTTSGGVISALGTTLTLKSLTPHGLPRNPRTLVWKSAPLTQRVDVGLKSKLRPSFSNPTTSYKRYSAFDANITRLNPFKDLGYFKNRTVLDSKLDLTKKSIVTGRGFSTTTTGDASTIAITREDSPAANYRVTLPLSNNQKCLFTLDQDTSVKSFLSLLHEEDPSLKNISILSKDGIKFAGSTKLSEVVTGPFQISMNGKSFSLVPTIGKTPSFATHAQVAIPESYGQLKKEMVPIYVEKVRLDKKSERQANWVVWSGLAYLVAQGAFLARLTWWEFNWDIMEPVTYFVTFGTVLLGYFWFTVTRREYTFSDIRESALQSRMFRNYIRYNFPVEKYYTLEHKLKTLDPEAMEKIDWEINTGLHKEEVKQADMVGKPAM